MLGLLQPKQYQGPEIDVRRDTRRIGRQQRQAAHKPLKIVCEADVEGQEVMWRVKASALTQYQADELERITEAIERLRQPNRRWPVIAYYGTGRVAEGTKPAQRPIGVQDRMDGYINCLNPSASDGALLEWMRQETFGDLARKERGEPERGFWRAAAHAMVTAAPDLSRLVYDPATDDVWVTFKSGEEARWGELSDGFHVFLGLVGDIARRATILNEQDGIDAPALAEGVVLIDEVDLQAGGVRGLIRARAASPLLLSDCPNHSRV